MTMRTNVKAGGMFANHNQGLKTRTAVKAGGMFNNHNQGVAQ
jgi:hypothetical protein